MGRDYGSYFRGSNFMSILQEIFSNRVYAEI